MNPHTQKQIYVYIKEHAYSIIFTSSSSLAETEEHL